MMKPKTVIWLVFVCGMLALGACSQTVPTTSAIPPTTLAPVSPTLAPVSPTLTRVPTTSPTATPSSTVTPTEPEQETQDTLPAETEDTLLPDECLTEDEDSTLFVNPVDGYCLRYPARFRVGDVYPPGIANLYGPPHDQTLEPVMAASTILVVDAVQDLALADNVDRWLAQHGVDPVTKRGTGLLGGEPAEIVEGQGERSGMRATFVLHDNRLYVLTFYPVDERFPQAAPDIKELWDTVTRSFAFLSPEALDKGGADPTPTETPAPPQLSFEIATYRDKQSGFEFDHPRSWSACHQENQGRGSFVQLCGTPPESRTLQVTVMLWEPHDLEGFAAQHEQSWSNAGNVILARDEWTLADDHQAIRYLLQDRSGERDFVFMTTVRDRYLMLVGRGDLDLLDEIARTVRVL